MYTDIERRRPSLATDIQRWISPLASKMQRQMASLAKKPKKAMVLDLSANWIHDTILAVAVLAGAVAFGFWWDSLSAGLFAGFALFFLAGIHRALRHIVANLRWEPDRMVAANSNGNTSGIAEGSDRNFEVSVRAIEHLLPWVKDEASLTEESAKAYCSVLLETLAALQSSFQGDCLDE